MGHEAAYGYRSGMSHAEIPHPEDAFAISAAKLREFLHAIRVGQDFVVVGTGISDHDEFVRLISDRLESIPPSHSSDSPRCLTRECETYVGGEWFPQESTWRNIPMVEEKSNILMLFKGMFSTLSSLLRPPLSFLYDRRSTVDCRDLIISSCS